MAALQAGCLLTAGLLILAGDVNAIADDSLACHQCHVTESGQCSQRPLPCPTDQAYDRCRTTLRRRDGGDTHVIKDCTLGKCWLDSSSTSALGLDRCDTSRPSFECVFCCTESGCNFSSAAPEHRAVTTTSALCLFVITSRIP